MGDARIACPECGTETTVPVEEAKAKIDRHNESLHDGREVADFAPGFIERLTAQVASMVEGGEDVG